MPDGIAPQPRTAPRTSPGRRAAAVCEVVLDQAPPEPLLRLVRDRFGEPSLGDNAAQLLLSGLDQAALRALLNLVWDTGLGLRSVRWLG